MRGGVDRARAARKHAQKSPARAAYQRAGLDAGGRRRIRRAQGPPTMAPARVASLAGQLRALSGLADRHRSARQRVRPQHTRRAISHPTGPDAGRRRRVGRAQRCPGTAPARVTARAGLCRGLSGGAYRSRAPRAARCNSPQVGALARRGEGAGRRGLRSCPARFALRGRRRGETPRTPTMPWVTLLGTRFAPHARSTRTPSYAALAPPASATAAGLRVALSAQKRTRSVLRSGITRPSITRTFPTAPVSVG
jgi:hypothetical protein